MKTKVTYQCDICEQAFTTPEEAQICEQRGREKAIVAIGDIVFAKSGYGWFDGDEKWVSNPKVRMNMHGTKLSAHQVPAPGPCRDPGSNCFDDCCTFKFYYVVTAIDWVDGYDDRKPGHRVRYTVLTKAMSGKEGHTGGWTYNSGHYNLELVKNPPAAVVKDAESLIGKKAKFIL